MNKKLLKVNGVYTCLDAKKEQRTITFEYCTEKYYWT